MASNTFPCAGTEDHPCPGDALGYKCYGIDRYLCRLCEVEMGLNPNGAPVGKVLTRNDDAVLVGGLQVVNGSTLLAQQLNVENCDVFCCNVNFDMEELKPALERLVANGVFVEHIEGSKNNRGSNTFTTGFGLHDRTKAMLVEEPVFAKWFEMIAPEGKAEVTDTWLTNSECLSDYNPNAGKHWIHGDGSYRNRQAHFRVAQMIGDSERGKVFIFQNMETGVWVHVAAPSGTLIVITEYGGGVGDSPIHHGVLYGDETYTLLAHIKFIPPKWGYDLEKATLLNCGGVSLSSAEAESGMSSSAIAGIVVASVVGVALIGLVLRMIHGERTGKPLFTPAKSEVA